MKTNLVARRALRRLALKTAGNTTYQRGDVLAELFALRSAMAIVAEPVEDRGDRRAAWTMERSTGRDGRGLLKSSASKCQATKARAGGRKVSARPTAWRKCRPRSWRVLRRPMRGF